MVRETFSTMLMITSSPALKLGVAFTVNVCSSSCDQLLVGRIQDGIHGVMQALIGGFRGDAHLLAQPHQRAVQSLSIHAALRFQRLNRCHCLGSIGRGVDLPVAMLRNAPW